MLDPIFYPVMGISIGISLGVALAITVIQRLRGKTSRFLRYFLVMLIGCLLTFIVSMGLSIPRVHIDPDYSQLPRQSGLTTPENADAH